jgi:DNA-binding Lrp family transcriptional regulator
MKAYILIHVRTGEILQVLDLLKRVDEVIEAHMTLGPYDAIAVIQAAGVQDLGGLLANKIQPIPGILETLTCLAI